VAARFEARREPTPPAAPRRRNSETAATPGHPGAGAADQAAGEGDGGDRRKSCGPRGPRVRGPSACSRGRVVAEDHRGNRRYRYRGHLQATGTAAGSGPQRRGAAGRAARIGRTNLIQRRLGEELAAVAKPAACLPAELVRAGGSRGRIRRTGIRIAGRPARRRRGDGGERRAAAPLRRRPRSRRRPPAPIHAGRHERARAGGRAVRAAVPAGVDGALLRPPPIAASGPGSAASCALPPSGCARRAASRSCASTSGVPSFRWPPRARSRRRAPTRAGSCSSDSGRRPRLPPRAPLPAAAPRTARRGSGPGSAAGLVVDRSAIAASFLARQLAQRGLNVQVVTEPRQPPGRSARATSTSLFLDDDLPAAARASSAPPAVERAPPSRRPPRAGRPAADRRAAPRQAARDDYLTTRWPALALPPRDSEPPATKGDV